MSAPRIWSDRLRTRLGAMTGLLKRSVTLNGHRTSVSLEPEFWDEVKRLADLRALSVNALISEIDHARTAASASEPRNLSSAVRVYVLRNLRKPS